MAEKKRTFSIRQMMMIAAYIALVIVVFQRHWVQPSKWFPFWYPAEGLISGLLFLGRAEPLIRAVAFFVIPWLIFDVALRLKALLFDANFQPMRRNFGRTVAKFALLKGLGLACLLYWLVEPHADFEDPAWSDDQIIRVLNQLTFVVPLFGLLCIAAPIIRVRPVVSSSHTQSRIFKGSMSLNKLGYVMCLPLIAILGFTTLVGQSIVPSLVAIATHSIEIGMPTGYSTTTSVTDYQPGKFGISSFTDLYAPLAFCSCLSLVSLIASISILKSAEARTKLFWLAGWAITTTVLLAHLFETVGTFLSSQQHWFDILINYRSGSILAFSLTAVFGMVTIALFHRSANGKWERVNADAIQLRSIWSPWWLACLAVGLMPVSIHEITATLLLASGLLCLELRRAQSCLEAGAEIEVFNATFSPIAPLVSWITYSVSVSLAAITFGLFGIALFTNPEWPEFIQSGATLLDQNIEYFGILCWITLVGCTVIGVLRLAWVWWHKRRRRTITEPRAQ